MLKMAQRQYPFSVLIEKPTFVTSKCLWNQYFELTRQFTDVNKGAESKS